MRKKDPPFVRAKHPPDLNIKEGGLVTSPFFYDVTQRRSCKSGHCGGSMISREVDFV